MDVIIFHRRFGRCVRLPFDANSDGDNDAKGKSAVAQRDNVENMVLDVGHGGTDGLGKIAKPVK